VNSSWTEPGYPCTANTNRTFTAHWRTLLLPTNAFKTLSSLVVLFSREPWQCYARPSRPHGKPNSQSSRNKTDASDRMDPSYYCAFESLPCFITNVTWIWCCPVCSAEWRPMDTVFVDHVKRVERDQLQNRARFTRGVGTLKNNKTWYEYIRISYRVFTASFLKLLLHVGIYFILFFFNQIFSIPIRCVRIGR